MGITATRVHAIVDRDAHKIPVEVFEHELPILERVHGKGTVRVLQGEKPANKTAKDTRPQAVTIEDAHEEWERLHRKYKRGPFNPVVLAYPGGERQFTAVLNGQPEHAANASDDDKPVE